MYVDNIRLINFRNYLNLNIELNKKLNIFVGNNAQGKTNLLESIYICANGKSYRTSKDRELINLQKSKGYIGLSLAKERFSKLIELKFERDVKKRIKVNKVEYNRVSELIGILNVVIFSPEDLRLVKEGPMERRAFLDGEISQIKPKYKYNLARYNKILMQRNNFLKNRLNSNFYNLLDVWDTQLSQVGSSIIIERVNFINKLAIISKDIHNKLTGGIEELDLKYLPSFDIDKLEIEEIQLKLKDMLQKNIEKDIQKGNTEYGPHRDDLDILINGISARTFGSQGQQRTAALSLKLAEVELIKNEIGEYPVLLLDDVFSELDLNRRKYLISTFKDIQTIITSTDDIDLTELKGIDKKVFYIRQGEVVLQEEG
ncbi:DNA replication and repair protein RecF [Proteiniborus ethanoligenes]|uniref:DNA replication and repair protein RecF n=1 Tax=Proteiniborus ethanoligenes TaxID=415015 RepID=A0A1H3NLH5_9FIRM|nr:DNA replication/repair protein RecF [Proteiniborus ethanoligenes]SDY89603.1 DNA replication and repair protein RecF [Proteiniborus ethanoligenes]